MARLQWVAAVLAVVLCGAALTAEAGMPSAGESNSAVFMDIRPLQHAAEGGNWAAQYELGMRYEQGRDVTKDEAQAVAWFRKAADQGHDMALLMLGQAYEFGRGVDKDPVQAFTWYKKAADDGQPSAEAALSRLYGSGTGVAKDHDAALSWDRKAADQNLFSAMFDMAEIYRADGDAANMVKWHDKACDKGYAMSCYTLGNHYYDGAVVAANPAKALDYYKKGALLGLPDAQYQVGRMYYNGEGAAGDDIEAYTWLSLAADNGEPDAQDDLATIEPQYTSEQKAQAQTRKAAYIKAIEKRQGDVGVFILYNLHGG